MSARVNRRFLSKMASVQNKTNDVFGELTRAVREGDIEKLKKLVSKYFGNNFQSLEENFIVEPEGRQTRVSAVLIQEAVIHSQFKMIQFLNKQGLHINTQDAFGQCALSIVCTIPQNEKFPLTAREKVIDFLLTIPQIDLELTNIDGDTPLTHALHKDYSNIALKLIKAGANVNHKTQEDHTPISIAVKHGTLEVVQALHQAGADLNSTFVGSYTINTDEPIFETPLYRAISRSTARDEEHPDPYCNDPRMAEYLLNNGARLSEEMSRTLPLLVSQAILNKFHNSVNFLLLQNSYPINLEIPMFQGTLLQYAVKFSSHQVVTTLIKRGADTEVVDYQGNTLLMLSIIFNQLEKAKLFLNELEGDDHSALYALQRVVDLITQSQNIQMVQLVLGYLIQNKKLSSERLVNLVKVAFLNATRAGSLDIVQYLLESQPRIVNLTHPSTVHGFTFVGNTIQAGLICAAHSGQLALLKLLWGLNNEKEVVSDDGKTLLMLAVEAGQLEVVKFLFDFKLNIDAKMKDGTTALMLAVYHGEVDIVTFLLKRKATLEGVNSDGQSALTIAIATKQTKCLKEIIKYRLFRELQLKNSDPKNVMKCLKLSELVSNRLVDNHSIFEVNGNLVIRCQEEEISDKSLFEVLDQIFQQVTLETMNTSMQSFDDMLWRTTEKYKAAEVKEQASKALEEKQLLERKKIEEKLAFEKELEDLAIGLDFETISSRFPWTSSSNRNLTTLFDKMDADKGKINDLIGDRDLFLSSSIAARIESIKEKKEILLAENRSYLIDLEKIYKRRQEIEEELGQLKQAFVDRSLELSLRIKAKFSDAKKTGDTKLLAELKNLKVTLLQDEDLKQILELRLKLGNEVDGLHKNILELHSKVTVKRTQEHALEDQYYLSYKKEEEVESSKIEIKKKQEADRLKRAMEEKIHREKLARKKALSKAYYMERLAKSEQENLGTNKTRLKLRFEAQFYPLEIKMIDEELKFVTDALKQLSQSDQKAWDENIKAYHGLGLLNMCARLMEMVLHLPEEMALMSLHKASHFRDVVYHASRLPRFTLEQARQMTDLLVQYIQATKSHHMMKKSDCWADLHEAQNEIQSIFAKILAFKIEDDDAYFESSVYLKGIEQERKRGQEILEKSSGIPILMNNAIAFCIARMGANAGRLKEVYPEEFNKLNRELQLGDINRWGKKCRHLQIGHEESQQLEWRNILEHRQSHVKPTSSLSASAPPFIPLYQGGTSAAASTALNMSLTPPGIEGGVTAGLAGESKLEKKQKKQKKQKKK